MSANKNSSQELLSYLKFNGPTLSSELVSRFGISRPTLSRRVHELGNAVVSIGHARATMIAARLQEFSGTTPLYMIKKSGRVERIGQLTPVRDGERVQWLLKSDKALPVFFEGEFKNGLYPGWPWFLEDLRPSGFLGRSFGKRMAELLQVDENPEKWGDLELLNILTSHGSNLHGNLLVGDGRALEEYQRERIRNADVRYPNTSPEVYQELADLALREGGEFGSSAGGEQPKFTTVMRDNPQDDPRAVIVKFSPQLESPAGLRWADLLYAEQIANEVLRGAGFETAQTRTFHRGERVFLESTRFDRVGISGRRGVVTLRAIDAAHLGQGSGSWADVAPKLYTGKWITAEDRDRMIQLHCFGELIANTDMHWGNLSFFLPEESPYPLAPVYDMLPMRFRPSSTGEVVERDFEPRLPKPENQKAWLEMYPHAIQFWQKVSADTNITSDFKSIAKEALGTVEKIHKTASA